MRLVFIAHVQLPSPKVHGIQVAHMCDAFSAAGHEVTLLVPRPGQAATQDIFSYYGLARTFQVVHLPSIGSAQWGAWGFRLRALTFSISALVYTLFRQADVVFSREEFPLVLLRFASAKRIWEIHNEKLNRWGKRMLTEADRIVAISGGLARLCIDEGAPRERVYMVPNGVAHDRFKEVEGLSRAACRDRLSLPQDKKLVVYTGHLYPWKGVVTLAAASCFIDHDTTIVFVGRCDPAVKEEMLAVGDPTRMQLLGEQPYEDIACYLKAADVLALPTSATTARAREYTSAVKLFEYMLAERPVVATDIPSTREILDTESAYFAAPDDAQSLASCIMHAVAHPTEAHQKAFCAHQAAQQYTWTMRVARIMEGV